MQFAKSWTLLRIKIKSKSRCGSSWRKRHVKRDSTVRRTRTWVLHCSRRTTQSTHGIVRSTFFFDVLKCWVFVSFIWHLGSPMVSFYLKLLSLHYWWHFPAFLFLSFKWHILYFPVLIVNRGSGSSRWEGRIFIFTILICILLSYFIKHFYFWKINTILSTFSKDCIHIGFPLWNRREGLIFFSSMLMWAAKYNPFISLKARWAQRCTHCWSAHLFFSKNWINCQPFKTLLLFAWKHNMDNVNCHSAYISLIHIFSWKFLYYISKCYFQIFSFSFH